MWWLCTVFNPGCSWIGSKLYPFSTWYISFSLFRDHRIIQSTLSSTNLNLRNLIAVFYHPEFTAPLVSVSINIFWVLITRLPSSAGGNTTITWTSATTNLRCPSSQNHSAILHSAHQLPLPLPITTLPNFSSCPKSPNQVLLCLRLLSQNSISFKEQLGAIKPARSQLPVLTNFKCLISIHPLSQS